MSAIKFIQHESVAVFQLKRLMINRNDLVESVTHCVGVFENSSKAMEFIIENMKEGEEYFISYGTLVG